MSKICYNKDCDKEIIFDELRAANYNVSTAKLSKWFNSPYTEFYCCECYKIICEDEEIKEDISMEEFMKLGTALKNSS